MLFVKFMSASLALANEKFRSCLQFDRLGSFLFRFLSDDFQAYSKDRNFRHATRNPKLSPPAAN